jgi:hypothetical protein
MSKNDFVEVSFKLPIVSDSSNQEEIEDILFKQTKFLIDTWRDVLSKYKDQKIGVPTISMRSPLAKKANEPTAYKVVSKELFDYCIHFMPNANPLDQRVAIKRLIETGLSKEELIKRFDESMKDYPFTTWRTVLYKLSKETKEEETSNFERVELDEEQQKAIIERIKAKNETSSRPNT